PLVSVNPQGLSAGTYTAVITINTQSGVQAVNVILLVTSDTVLLASPGSINVNLTSSSLSVALTLGMSDGSRQGIAASSLPSWVIATALSDTTLGFFLMTIDPTTLCNGLNVGSITVASSAVNSPMTIPVVAYVTESTNVCPTAAPAG